MYRTGMVVFYDAERGFGFLWSEYGDSEFFFHITDYKGEKDLERGDVVSFTPTNSDGRPKAKEIRLVEVGKMRDPALVGITCWTGPRQLGEYGIAIHKRGNEDGTFIHKTCLVDGSSSVETNSLYKLDVAKNRDRYIGLNVSLLRTDDHDVIAKLAYDPDEDPHVKLKALEILSIIEGRHDEFVAKVQGIAKSQHIPPPEEITVKVGGPFGNFSYTQKGEPSDNTVKIVICGVLLGIAGLAAIVILKSMDKGGESRGDSGLLSSDAL